MEEALIKRVLPHNTEAEQLVIGCMLMDKEAISAASEIIHSDDFYGRQYGAMFEAITELYNEGKPTDLVAVQEQLKTKDVPPESYSIAAFRELLNMVPTSVNIRYYANLVYEKALLRRLIRINEEIANDCYMEKEDVNTILESTEKRIFGLLETRATSDYVPIRDVVINVVNKIEIASRNHSMVTGLSTGYTDLDRQTSGMQPSDLILIAARPSMGKTAFVLNLAHNMTIKDKKTVAIFSLEMSKEQLVNRLFSLESHVDAQILRTGNLSDTDWEKLIEGAGTIGSSRMIIDDTSGITISEMRSKCRKYKLEMGLDLVIIDYLQLMSGSNSRRNESRQQEISEISRSLKGLARELNVPVIALSQLSRAVEQRTDKRPMLSDLRESGAIEQDADVCMFIYRDDYYNPDTEDKNIAEIIIAKQRNGPIGTVRLAWMPQYTRFGNEERRQERDS
jgi:replicative DNA helicase